MRRWLTLLTVLCFVLYVVRLKAAVPFDGIASCSNTAAGPSAADLACSATLTVQVGDVLIGFGSNANGSTTHTMSDGNGHSFTMLTSRTVGSTSITTGYYEVTGAGVGTITPVATFSGSSSTKRIGITHFRPGAGYSLEFLADAGATATGNPWTSQSMTATGTSNLLVLFFIHSGGSGSSGTINGSAAEVFSAFPGGTTTYRNYTTNLSSFTGQTAGLTISTNTSGSGGVWRLNTVASTNSRLLLGIGN